MRVRTAFIVTSVSAVLFGVAANTTLALTTKNYCIVLLNIPFTDHSYQLPYWWWSASILLTLLCVPVVLISWILVALRAWKLKRTS
jgi:hypothetical protein